MRLESYAQELEDLILFSALRNVEKGFYIDVGANDPTNISVTRFFYNRGWNGINIEPQPAIVKILEEERPRDINLCCGIGKERGKLKLYGNGTGASFSEEVKNNRNLSDENEVDVFTLSEIHKLYPPPICN
ncbi:MAG: FkbM family methyltransferase [Selenomonadaceae bacterium]|nr:FkbM family methyltransferase [Selenomonadaceae bacterium]